MQAGSVCVAFDAALWYLVFRPAFTGMATMSWWLRFTEMSNGFRCPNGAHSDGMGIREELNLGFTEPMRRPRGTSEGV